MSKDEMNKTREYTIPGDINNPNRCRDEGVILSLIRLESESKEHWKELARLWEVVKFGNTPPPPRKPVPPSKSMNMIKGLMPCSRCSNDASSVYPVEVVRILGDGSSSHSFECPYCHLLQVINSNRTEAICTWNEYQAKDRKVAKPADQPAGKLREWWVVFGADDDWGAVYKSKQEAEEQRWLAQSVHVREVPSPERVKEVLDKGHQFGWSRWYLANLLRSLGHDTEGL